MGNHTKRNKLTSMLSFFVSNDKKLFFLLNGFFGTRVLNSKCSPDRELDSGASRAVMLSNGRFRTSSTGVSMQLPPPIGVIPTIAATMVTNREQYIADRRCSCGVRKSDFELARWSADHARDPISCARTVKLSRMFGTDCEFDARKIRRVGCEEHDNRHVALIRTVRFKCTRQFELCEGEFG